MSLLLFLEHEEKINNLIVEFYQWIFDGFCLLVQPRVHFLGRNTWCKSLFVLRPLTWSRKPNNFKPCLETLILFVIFPRTDLLIFLIDGLVFARWSFVVLYNLVLTVWLWVALVQWMLSTNVLLHFSMIFQVTIWGRSPS